MDAKNKVVNNSPLSAERAYANIKTQINGLVFALQEHLEAHAAKAKADPTNWGYVGDMQHYRELLMQLVKPD